LPIEWSKDLNYELDAGDFVEGVLVDGCLAVVYGDSSVGKSFWVIYLGLHIAGGRHWYDRAIDQGIVIYISLEGGKLTKNRVIKAREELKLPPDVPFALVTCPLDMRTSDADAIRLANTIRQAISQRSGQNLPDDDKPVSDDAIDSLPPDDEEQAISERSSQNLPVRLVIIDTMSRALNGGAENDVDMGLLLKHTDFVRRETGVAILFVAHCGKDAAKGIRGWSGVRAAIDVEIEICKTDGAHVAHVTKERDLAEGDRFAFSLKQVEVGLNSRRRMVTTCVVVHADNTHADNAGTAAAATKTKTKTSPLGRKFLEALCKAIHEAKTMRSHGHPACTIEHWRTHCGKNGLFDGNPKEAKNRALFSKYKSELIVKNQVKCDEIMAWTLAEERTTNAGGGGDEALPEIPF
jgi:hypothetical protein